ncbi:hypothetical protein ASF43_21105 [Pseudorhodoferax sp. Leaf267]|nr:hypothetical protein ASF43_21105 [Pseudorhodoferax sp. Leaf267]
MSPLLAAIVSLLMMYPWLNPMAPGPVPSVFPWLLSALLVCFAVIASASHGPRPAGSLRFGLAVVCAFATTLAWAALPRHAVASPYDWLALVGGLWLVALGGLLAWPSGGATNAANYPWAYWCVLWPWLAAGLVSCVLGLLQYTNHALSLAPWVNWAPQGEAFANLRQRNQFASLSNIALAALLAWCVLPRRKVERARGAKLAMAAALALPAIGNAASSSRTGLLQLLCICASVLVWRSDWRVGLWLAWTLACYAIAVLSLPWLIGLDPAAHGMFSRLRTGDALCSSRLTLWHNVLDLIAQRPWLGWGWGELDYAHYMTLYDGPRFCDILDNAHNLPLHLAVELGVPAAVLFCAACLWAVIAQRPWRETDPMRQLAWMVLAVIAAHSLLEYPLWYGPFQLATGLCLGMLWRGRPAPAGARGPALWPVLLAMLMIGACAYAAWDYRRISQIYLPPAQRLPQYRGDTMGQIQRSWLFQRQVRFAELSISSVTPENAAHLHALATELLHFSPEARVVEKLLDSARLLGLDEEVREHAARFEAAFPKAYAAWAARSGFP